MKITSGDKIIKRWWSLFILHSVILVLFVAPCWAGLSNQSQEVPTSTNYLTYAVAWGDIDGDGDLDLAVGNFHGSGEYIGKDLVFENVNGTLNAAPIWQDITTADTSCLAWADLDNDGDLDLVVGHNAGANAIYENTGTYPYLSQFAVWQSSLAEATTAIAVADVDKDGDLDIVEANNGQWIRLYKNTLYTSPGQKSGKDDLADLFPSDSDWRSVTPYETYDMALGDVTGDGYVDIVCANAGVYKNTIYFWDVNNGRFADNPSWTAQEGKNSRGVALGDMNKDGNLDVIFANYSTSEDIFNQVYLSNGTPSFPQDPVWEADQTNKCLSVAVIDVDNDGDLDIAFGTTLNEPVLIYYNNGGIIEDTPSWSSEEFSFTRSLAWGDVDGDGDLDLCVGNYMGKVGIYYNDVPILPSTGEQFPIIRNYYAVRAGYLDNTAGVDLFAGGSSKDQIYYNGSTTVGWTSTRSVVTKDAVIADFDNDGDNDLITASENEYNMLFVNEEGVLGTSSAWQSAEDFPKLDTRGVAVGDIDRDLDLDVAFAEFEESNRIYKSTSGTLNPEPDWLSDKKHPSTCVAFGDIDGDGWPELVVGNAHRKIEIYYNTGGEIQINPVWLSANKYVVRDIKLADIDDDGDIDMLVACDGCANMVFYNTGGGGMPQRFNTTPDWTSIPARNTQQTALADIDNDGDLDWICSNKGQADTIYLNNNGSYDRNPWWQSNYTSSKTMTVAAGDHGKDGDIDLVFGMTNTPLILFENHFSPEAHLLPNDPAFVFIKSNITDVQTGKVEIEYLLYDDESDPCSIIPQYSFNGSNQWYAATEAEFGSDGVTELSSAPYSQGGQSHKFIWDADKDALNSGLGTAFNSDWVTFRILVKSNPGNVGLITRPALGSVSAPMRVKPVPDIKMLKPENGGFDNVNITLEYFLSEDCTVMFIFRCVSMSAPDQKVVAYKLGGGQKKCLPGAAGYHHVIIDAEDLLADQDLTTDDYLIEQQTYEVIMRASDTYPPVEPCNDPEDFPTTGNITEVRTYNWTYDNTPPTLYGIYLQDIKLEPNQEAQYLNWYTNDVKTYMYVDFNGNANYIYTTENVDDFGNPIYGEPDEFSCPPAGQCVYEYELAYGDRNATLFVKLKDDAGNFTGDASDSICLDTRYYTNDYNFTIQVGDGGQFHATRDLTISWRGFTEPINYAECTSGLAGFYYRSSGLGRTYDPGLYPPASFGVWTTQRSVSFEELPNGYFDFEVRPQDRAGNRSSAYFKTRACIDTQKPSWKQDAWICINDCESIWTNQPVLTIDWGGYQDTGCGGIYGFNITYKVDGQPYPCDPVNNPCFALYDEITWLNAPDGLLEVCVEIEDRAGNKSTTKQCAQIRKDSQWPRIALGGYLLSNLDTFQGGDLMLFAWTPYDSDVYTVEMYLPDETGVLEPTGIYLRDDGQQGDAIAGDGVWTYYAKLGGGLPGGEYLIALVAQDNGGNMSDPWPFANIRGLQVSASENGSWRIDYDHSAFLQPWRLDYESSLRARTKKAADRYILSEKLDALHRALEPYLKQHQESAKGSYELLMLAGGYATTNIDFFTGGELVIWGVPWDTNLGWCFADMQMRLFYIDTFQQGRGTEQPLEIFLLDPNQDCIYELRVAVPPLVPPGPYILNTNIEGLVIGGYLFGLQVKDPTTERVSQFWPYLNIEETELRCITDADPTAGQPGLIVTFYHDAAGGTPPYKSFTWNFGDGSAPEVFYTPGYVQHQYNPPGDAVFTATMTVQDNANATSVCTETITISDCLPGELRIGACHADPSSSQTYPVTVQFHFDNYCEAPDSVFWTFGDGGTSSEYSPSHTYQLPGSYHVTMTATKGSQTDGCETDVFIGCPELELASCSADPKFGTAPLTVTFRAQASGGQPPYTYIWDFGDGSSDQATSSGEAVLDHVYQSTGEYDASLTIQDSCEFGAQVIYPDECDFHISVGGACDKITGHNIDSISVNGFRSNVNMSNVKSGEFITWIVIDQSSGSTCFERTVSFTSDYANLQLSTDVNNGNSECGFESGKSYQVQLKYNDVICYDHFRDVAIP